LLTCIPTISPHEQRQRLMVFDEQNGQEIDTMVTD